MRRLKFSVLFFYIFMIIMYFCSVSSEAKNSKDVNSRIIKETNGSVIEYGLRYEFYFNAGGKEKSTSIYNKIFEDESKMDEHVTESSSKYLIEFNSDVTNGYIQYTKEGKEKIIINIIQRKNIDGLEYLKKNIDTALKQENVTFIYYQYIKAQIDIEDIVHTKELVTNILKESGALRIKVMEIGTGYSITAFTGQYEPMKSGSELIDINCAICNYKSGSYLVIGNPIISTSY